MSEKELRAGDFVTSSVRLVRPLAEGGMGRVWIAEHLGLHTEVVVKLMAKEMAARDDGATRFAREAAIAAAIKSPHVVQIFDHGVTAEHGVPYIVMELLEGRDLGAMLHERGRLEPTEAAAVIVQVGKALSKAHQASIIHRDIKPENIFLTESDDGQLEVKLLDFGTAKLSTATSATLPGEIMGTPYYMSPEQSVGAMVDARTDMWSLGVVAFEALTGTRPFEGPNVGAIALAIHGRLPTLSERAADLPLELDAWFAQACAQVPQDRFGSMREMTAAFVEALTGTAPASDQTESICIPARKISVRPAVLPPDDMRNTMPTSIEPSIPPPPQTAPEPIAPLAATLPDRSKSQRTTKIAAGIVGVAAVAVMAFIVFPHSSAPAPVVAAAPPPPAPVEPAVTIDPPAPPPVVAPPAATHKKTAKKAATAPTGKKTKDPKQDEDLARLLEASGPHEPATMSPTPSVAPSVAPPPLPEASPSPEK